MFSTKRSNRVEFGHIQLLSCFLFLTFQIAYMLAKTVVVGDPAVSLGIFACGICPGGGPSNMYSYLLDGDVSLSVTMTALSSISAFGKILNFYLIHC